MPPGQRGRLSSYPACRRLHLVVVKLLLRANRPATLMANPEVKKKIINLIFLIKQYSKVEKPLSSGYDRGFTSERSWVQSSKPVTLETIYHVLLTHIKACYHYVVGKKKPKPDKECNPANRRVNFVDGWL